MGFRFNLDNVLRHRRRTMEGHALEVAAAERRLATLVGRREEISRALNRETDSGHPEVGVKIQMGDLLEKSRWLALLDQRDRELATACVQARQQLGSMKEELEGAWRQCEVLENLKRKKRSAWQQDQIRRERRESDEIGVQRYVKRWPA